ncbi:putative arm-like repeat-containing protein [Diaporthe ampelina]|uniref:Putative arm-like repeat-containing protein n=1 Tax=Diaporthe ampelina TaxID=1214573 RepID=A0A0G2FWI1_9PEZI|nr:putative arm-like repeat-containing protein [Diaporthe ampelina]
MGKSRRNRAHAHRADPISAAIKPVKAPTDPELAALREKRILPVIKDLRSVDPRARSAAAGAVANIVQDAKCRKLLLREQIVPIVLTETLTDASLDSRAAGWEILRVIASEEESDFCVHLFRLDALTAIEHAGKNIIQTIAEPSFSKAPKAQQQVMWNITTALIALINALATARDEILDAIASNPQIVPFLCLLVTHTSTPYETSTEALSCLMSLSEDNLKVSQLILADPSSCFRTLTKFKEGTDVKSVYSCGVLHNVFSSLEWHDGSPGQDGATDAQLIPSLSRVLERTRQEPKTNQIGGVSPEAASLALEILASIATDLQGTVAKGDKDKEEWDGIEDDEAMEEDGDDEAKQEGDDGDTDLADPMEADGAEDEEDDEMDEDAMEADLDLITRGDDDAEDDSGIDDLPTLKEFMTKAVPHIVRMANLVPASDEAVAVQSEAFSALNNISWTLSCFDYSETGNAGILKAWTPAAKRIWSNVIAPVLMTDTADISLASLVTSIAWAISRTLQGSTPLVGDEHRKFIALYKASKGLIAKPEDQGSQEEADPFQALGVKCVGVLGQLAQDPAPISLNREVGIFLITILNALPDTPAADAVEALNQIMDVYGNETHTCDKDVFWKDNFLKHLEEILPKAKAVAKTIDKRSATAELRLRADEAVLNLGRFIQYKKKNPPKP